MKNGLKKTILRYVLVTALAVAAAFACLQFCGYTSDSKTIRTLRNAGYTDITTTGWSPFKCSEKDTLKTGFRARNPAGRMVEGTVCCGLVFKGCTIRF